MSGDDGGRAGQPESDPGPARHRDRVTMTAADQAALLAESRKLQLATINRDGTPHLVTMFYVMLDGQIAFWTYRSAQKARNLARDPRVTCLVETGDGYFELRGVQVVGVAQLDDGADVLDRPLRELRRGRARGTAHDQRASDVDLADHGTLLQRISLLNGKGQ